MLKKILKIIALGAAVAPSFIADAEGALAKIGADKSTVSKVQDGLDAALEAFSTLAKLL